MRVGIVGAGITGLAVGHFLAGHDVPFDILERSSEPGGVIRSERLGGRVLELGPQRTRASPPIAALIDELDLDDAVIEAADVPLYVYRDGDLRRAPLSIGTAVRTDLISTRGKLRALLEPLFDPPRSGETVHEYFTRAFGWEIADYVAGPLYGGIYGSDTRDMPVEYSLARALDRFGISGSLLIAALRSRLASREPPPIISFEAGLQTLPRRLADRYDSVIAFDTEATAVVDREDGYALEGEERWGPYDDIVLTVPAGTAGELLSGIDPDTAAGLHELTYNPLAVVHLEAEGDLTGAGYQIPRHEPFDTLGVTWNDSLLGRDRVYTAYLGGANRPGLVDRSSEDLANLAIREFETVTGVPASPLDVHRVRPGMPAYDRSWRHLEAIDPPVGIHLCANYTDRAGLPGRVTAARRLADDIASRPEVD